MEDMIPENVLVRKTGVQSKEIKFGDYVVKVKIKVMTNREIDDMAVRNIVYEGDSATPNPQAITNEAVTTGLLDINTTFKGKKYPELDDEEKGEFLDTIDNQLRDKIAYAVMGVNHVIGQERDFLSKQQ